MKWIEIKETLPPYCSNNTLPYVLAYHTVHGIGVAWFWKFQDEGLVQELEEEFKDKYMCSCQFIFNILDGNHCISSENDIDIFEHSPHFLNLGTVTHWMPLPEAPNNSLDKSLYLNKYFKFPEDNLLEWGRDFCVYSCDAPSRVIFQLTDFINDELVTLRAHGYGVIDKNDQTAYGCGAISMKLKDILPYEVKQKGV